MHAEHEVDADKVEAPSEDRSMAMLCQLQTQATSLQDRPSCQPRLQLTAADGETSLPSKQRRPSSLLKFLQAPLRLRKRNLLFSQLSRSLFLRLPKARDQLFDLLSLPENYHGLRSQGEAV